MVGLEIGADDYVTKPFSPRELVLRVDSILRRSSGGLDTDAPTVLVDGDLVVDRARRLVTLGGQETVADRRASSTCWPSWSSRPGRRVLPRRPAPAGVGLVVRRPVDRHRPRPPAAREGRARPHQPGAAAHRLGRRLPLGGDDVMSDLTEIWVVAIGSGVAVGLLGLLAGLGPAPPLAALAARGRRRRHHAHRAARRPGHLAPDADLRPRPRGRAHRHQRRRGRVAGRRAGARHRPRAVVAVAARGRTPGGRGRQHRRRAPRAGRVPGAGRRPRRPPTSASPRRASASSGSRSRAASWCRGSPTTCVRRSPGSG